MKGPFGSAAAIILIVGCLVVPQSGSSAQTSPRLNHDSLPPGMTCSSLSTCLAVGGVRTLGRVQSRIRWRTVASVVQSDLYSISCPSHTACFAVGGGGTIVATTDRGATWSRQSSATNALLQSISCPAVNTCYAAGPGVIVRTTNAGDNWHVLDASVGATSLACPSRSRCYGVGGSAIISTADAGLSWQSYLLAPAVALESVSCATARRCIAGGGESYYCQLAGRRNLSRQLPRAQPGARQDTCQESEVGSIARTSNAGRNWRVRLRLTSAYLGRAHIMSIVCAGATTCYAGGDDIWATTRNAGRTWTLTHPSFNIAIVLSCPAVRTCWAVAQGYLNQLGGVPMVTTDGGRTWSEPPDQSGSSGPEGALGIACPGVDLCFAVGRGGLILTWNSARPS